MNWKLLLPTTHDPISAWQALFSADASKASYGLSDLFILVTIYLALAFLAWGSWKFLRSLWRSGRYLKRLNKIGKKDGAYNTAKNDLFNEDSLPLFKELDAHLIVEPPFVAPPETGKKSPPRPVNLVPPLRRSVDAAEIFSDEVLGPGLSSSRLFQVVPGTLTGLGVLGTFVGLQLGIGGLNLDNLQQLDKSIVPLIQGCAVAFSTSVWGVVASLVFSLVEKAMEAFALGRVRKLQQRVDSLIPRYVPEEAMAGLERSSKETEKHLKGLAVAIGEHMQEAIKKLGGEIGEAVRDAVGKGQGPIADQAAQLLATAITAEIGKLREAVEGMSGEFSSKFNKSSDDLMSTVKSLEPTVATLGETMNAVRSTVTDAIAKLNAHESVMTEMAAAATNVKQAADTFASMNGTLEQASARNEEAAKAQLSAAEKNQEVTTKMSVVGEKLPEMRQTIEDAARVIGSLGGPIEELKKLLEQHPEKEGEREGKRAETENARSQQLLGMTNDLAATVTLAAQEFGKVSGMAQALSSAATSLQGASTGLAEFGSQVVAASKDQKSASSTSLAAAELNKLVASKLEPLPASLERVSTGLQAAGSSVASGAESARVAYTELKTLQAEWFKGAELGLNALRDRVQAIIQSYGEQIDGQTNRLMTQWTNEVTQCLTAYASQVEKIDGGINDLTTALAQMPKP